MIQFIFIILLYLIPVSVQLPLDKQKLLSEVRLYYNQQRSATDSLIATALEALKNKDDQAAAIAINKIAILRSPESIPFLIDHLEFSPAKPPFPGAPGSLSTSLPCVAALGRIGGVACHDAILKRFVASGSNDETDYARIVLKMSLGCDDAIALVKGRAEREKNPTAAKRLRALADSIDQHERTTTYQ